MAFKNLAVDESSNIFNKKDIKFVIIEVNIIDIFIHAIQIPS